MADFMRAALGIAIAMILIANVVISIAKSTNQTYTCGANASGATLNCGWSATEVTLWGLISLVAIMSLIYGVANAFGML